mmetsp:Transcript_35920/g.75630  ORF Transcript_35920/g.75630 Transcript_35920/m.75630 type:complete len:85 (-) Transcript_35920:975-1229(-)
MPLHRCTNPLQRACKCKPQKLQTKIFSLKLEIPESEGNNFFQNNKSASVSPALCPPPRASRPSSERLAISTIYKKSKNNIASPK